MSKVGTEGKRAINGVLQSLSDTQIAEMGIRYWKKSRNCHGSAADVYIRSAMNCQLEIERRADFRKVNR